MKPHLVRWHREFGDKGLVVIDINDAQYGSLKELRKDVADHDLPFPVLWDADSANTKAYGVIAQPSGFLVGVDGKVVWEGVPVTKVKEIEALIRAEVAKAKTED